MDLLYTLLGVTNQGLILVEATEERLTAEASDQGLTSEASEQGLIAQASEQASEQALAAVGQQSGPNCRGQ